MFLKVKITFVVNKMLLLLVLLSCFQVYGTVCATDSDCPPSKKPPAFVGPQTQLISLPENFTNYSTSLATLRAQSNVPDNAKLIFELITGRTEQTNSKRTFVSLQANDTASITLAKALDYEAITEYTLTMSVKNTCDLVSEAIIKIKVLDVNDNVPYFTGVTTGSISENEPPGTAVIHVRAFDRDGTPANNIVSFELADNTEYFTIDSATGNVTALRTFDREERVFYNVTVIATDNSPSSLYNTSQQNRVQQVFRIEIADKNDYQVYFQHDKYIAEELREDANVNFSVIEVKAEDNDAALQISYTIVDGNIGDAFKIESSTGKITVNSSLDYENTTDYSLVVRAFDGIYEDYATVVIRIKDANDNPPVFTEAAYNSTIEEEKLINSCVLTVNAYDPNIKNRSAPQNIKYFIVRAEQQSLVEIDNAGCVKLIKPLDRDPPSGHKHWRVYVEAVGGNGNGLRSVTVATITLLDVNDNAPLLTNQMPVIWMENQRMRKKIRRIIELTANDYDEPENGPPFFYEIDASASANIRRKFEIDGCFLMALKSFDREEQKEYSIPIRINDTGNPPMSQVSYLTVIIGDINDNDMGSGQSNILVYNNKGEASETQIGRVYVEDPDDWDLSDKSFSWKDDLDDPNFELDSLEGMIIMREGTKPGEYKLNFTVREKSTHFMARYGEVTANVLVTVKEISEEAVDKSGSIRLYGTSAEDFINDGSVGKLSKKDRLHLSLSHLFNTSTDNIDIFTIIQNEIPPSLDIRFSAHDSSYYLPEFLNGKIAQNQEKLEKEIGIRMLMINVDECMIEPNKCESSCTNVLHKSSTRRIVYTNRTSFVGVNAFVQAECDVSPKRTFCLNGDPPFADYCDSPNGFDGPNCEIISIGFYGDGYAMYPPFNSRDQTKISLTIAPELDRGLVMYIGPITYNSLLPISDFLALELVEGFLILTVDYGTGSITIEQKHIRLTSGSSYDIDIILQKTSIEMMVNNCKLSTCISSGTPQGPNEFFNVNAPLQLGGTAVNLEFLASQFNWARTPQSQGYNGSINNLAVNGRTYHIDAPSLSKNADPSCQRPVAVAVSLSIATNFLIAIIVCFAVLIILLLAVVVHKLHRGGCHEKDMDDISETSLNNQNESGGEQDTYFDLNVLRSPPIYEDKCYKENAIGQAACEMPDIGGFLVDKKDSSDKDTEQNLFDDTRHYAYEGDGNSTCSLFSLVSSTYDGEFKLDNLSYLENWQLMETKANEVEYEYD